MNDRRRDLIQRILRAESGWLADANELRRLPWNDRPPVGVLRVTDLRRVLERHAAGQMSAADLIAWAEILEVRPDLEVEDDLDEIKRCLFELSEPVMSPEPYREVVHRWRRAFAE